MAILLMFDASHQELTRRRAAGRVRDRVEHAAAEAAMGATILSEQGFIPAAAKWWGPVVLDAACRPHHPRTTRERDLSNLSGSARRRPQKPFSYTPS
ncbi:hypothetical protein G432_14905 [Sphingomonas sp. MM-1]|nr:hypothetical protein G432_14905 [Sphingomonas sp. MM-1]